MTPERFAQVEKVVRWRVDRWYWHPDWEDLCQEALLRAWQAVENHPGAFKLTTVAGRAADYAVIDFLRSPKALDRLKRPGQSPDPAQVSWEQIQQWALDNDEPALDQRRTLPMVADFAPELIELLAAQQAAAAVFALCTPREQEVLRRYYYDQQTLLVIARELGVTTSRVHQLLSAALERARGQKAAITEGAPQPACCRHGHPWTETNSWIDPHGRRRCRCCLARGQSRNYERHRQEKLCSPQSRY